jgi:sortase B
VKRFAFLGAILLLAAAGCYCAYRYYQSEVLPEKQLDEAEERQSALFEKAKPKINASDDGSLPADLLAEAETVNSAVAGWITIPDTNIDYPVCQAEDNEFYLRNGFDGQDNHGLGCPFLDYRCDADFSGFNSIVYAHHVSQRRMFADISLYKSESFFQAHRTGQLVLHDTVHTVQFFAYLNVYATAPAYHAVFISEREKHDYLEYIAEEADYCTYSAEELAEKTEDLHLLLLSTCTYEFQDARGILVGMIE